MSDIYQADTGARFIAEDDMIVRWLRRNPGARFEPVTFAWVMARLDEQPGGLFVDVGAATGWFSIPALLALHPVVGFECNPAVFSRLMRNLNLNGCDDHDGVARGVFHCGAASAQAGVAVFRFNPILPLTSGGSIEADVAVNTATRTVRTVTIDDTIGNHRVAVIKVDAEGHELPVLAGAHGVITRDRPHLVLEANTEDHVAELAAWCALHDYDWRLVDERNLLCSPRS